MEKNLKRSTRIFINNIDSYSSKHIAKFLSGCSAGESLENTRGQEDEEDDESRVNDSEQGDRFQIVGTVRNKNDKANRFLLEEYSELSRNELLHCLTECDVIVYNISEDAEVIDEAAWAVSALHSEMEHFEFPKMFILVSTLMTWAMTKPADPDEISLTEDDCRRKRPHPNFKEQASAEKLVLKLGKTKKSRFSTHVVAAGLQYGMGEGIFHFLFKASWLGQLTSLPDFGSGTNIIPTIHVYDLAGIVQNIIDHKPKRHYFVAVDASKNTLGEIMKAVVNELCPEGVKSVAEDEAKLAQELTQSDRDHFSLNLRIESMLVWDMFSVRWVCKFGVVEDIRRVVEEYRQTRRLLPIRICLLGPPAVGKTSVAARLCEHYKLHHVTVKEAIQDKIQQLEKMLESSEGESENDGALQELLDSLKESLTQNGEQLHEQSVLHAIREKLSSKACRNQGFVLDGHPITVKQAEEVFYDEDTKQDSRSKLKPYNKDIMPEYVFSLDATDEFLKERVRNLPQSVAEEMHYTQDEFLQCLSAFREMNTEEKTVLNYFDELEVHPEHIEIKNVDDTENKSVVEKIIQMVGEPLNYGPTPEEQAEEEQRRLEERQQFLTQEAVERELREADEEARTSALLEEWNRNVKEVRKQEQELLEAQSIPLRHYLMKNVIPTLTQGMLECCKARPEDPVDFLAEYLLRTSVED